MDARRRMLRHVFRHAVIRRDGFDVSGINTNDDDKMAHQLEQGPNSWRSISLGQRTGTKETSEVDQLHCWYVTPHAPIVPFDVQY
jgi:hypothetical protein